LGARLSWRPTPVTIELQFVEASFIFGEFALRRRSIGGMKPAPGANNFANRSGAPTAFGYPFISRAAHFAAKSEESCGESYRV
jgi:hypothetical protein